MLKLREETCPALLRAKPPEVSEDSWARFIHANGGFFQIPPSGCNVVMVFICSVGSMGIYLAVPHSHELQRQFGGRERREASSEEEGGSRLLRCKNGFMVDHAGIWAVSLPGHRSPAPGPLVFFSPLAQADKGSCLCLAGRKGAGVKTIPCLWRT